MSQTNSSRKVPRKVRNIPNAFRKYFGNEDSLRSSIDKSYHEHLDMIRSTSGAVYPFMWSSVLKIEPNVPGLSEVVTLKLDGQMEQEIQACSDYMVNKRWELIGMNHPDRVFFLSEEQFYDSWILGYGLYPYLPLSGFKHFDISCRGKYLKDISVIITIVRGYLEASKCHGYANEYFLQVKFDSQGNGKGVSWMNSGADHLVCQALLTRGEKGFDRPALSDIIKQATDDYERERNVSKGKGKASSRDDGFAFET